MGGWTGIGKDRINWNGQIEQKELSPKKDNDLITKKYADDIVDNIVVLDAEVATLDGNVLILQ